MEPEHWEVTGAPPEPPQSDPESGWTQESRRVGCIAQKIGMIHEYDDWLSFVPLTVLFIPGCNVIRQLTEESDGYTALQMGSGWIHPKNVSKPVLGHLKKYGIKQAKRKIQEFRVTPDALLPPGTEITAKHFIIGQKVDVCAISKGKGFQGPMKRWGFGGGNATHGNSKAHRSHGSMGGCQDPGKVWKGKKMAGRMGGKRVTVKNLQVYRIDPLHNLVYVRGGVPGPAKGWVRLTDAKNKLFQEIPPFPTHFKQPDEDMSEKCVLIPKPAEYSWDVDDKELRIDTLKENEQQKIVVERKEKAVQKEVRRKEEKSARKVRRIETRTTKLSKRAEELKEKAERKASLPKRKKPKEYTEDDELTGV